VGRRLERRLRTAHVRWRSTCFFRCQARYWSPIGRRGFLLRGNWDCWVLAAACCSGQRRSVGGILVPYGPGVAVTAHNLLVWLAALCHAAGVILAPWQRTAPAGRNCGWGCLCRDPDAGAAVVLATLIGAIPTFFIQGQGGTLPRQVVLGSAIALFVLTAILLQPNPRATPSAFRTGMPWPCCSSRLDCLGCDTIGFRSALSWTGRLAQYLGGVYLLVAAVVGLRETRDWATPGSRPGRSPAAVRGADRPGQRRDRPARASQRNGAWPFPPGQPGRLCAAGLYRPGNARADAPGPHRAGGARADGRDVEVMERDGLLRHEKTLLAKDGRRIPVEISTRQYPHQGRTLVISVIRDITERKQAEAAIRESEQFKQAGWMP